MADDKKEEKQGNPAKVVLSQNGDKSNTQHLDRDPNDPRRAPKAQANLSNLNKEDKEKRPEFQNPVQ